MNTKHKFFIAWVIICMALALLIEPRSRRRTREHFQSFYSSAIYGQVDSVRIAYRGAGLKLSDGKEFFFFPYTDKVLNESSIFEYIAEKGDTVIKPAFGDTIFLKKSTGKVLKYTSMHF